MILLPELFEHTLAVKPALAAAVRKSLDLFEPWLEQSGMPFFPGFTDHSPRHVNDVLKTAASLISDASRSLLTPEDVAVLSIAILLHDCGMHLTQDGFRVLVEKTTQPPVSGLGDLPWQYLWKEFLGEAQRFGEEKLIAIFGNAEPLRIDLLDIGNLSEKDCLLIGEFVRRHHARLAHEIAVSRVPSASHQAGLTLVGFDEDIKDIAGLVARSHWMSIRETFDYLGNRYGLISEYRQIKVPFLMAVLRIADYVQVQSERAIQTLLRVKELRSPISRQEWRAHFAVKHVSTSHDDPEALYVHAAPTDVKTFLKLTLLFKDIQRQLDDSWATLGEVYGRRGELALLGLTVRRIRSNLDSVDRFAKTVPYIPAKAGFDTSGPELLKLLVGPLYNYEFSVGIRELVQNAVDACRERTDLQVQGTLGDQQNQGDVVVDIKEADDGTGWIKVTDKGVGMTLDTVTKYFLVAGASFRNSDLWKRQHMEESGEVRPLRGGRFGVGVLAAFLLGEEIVVRTRHLTCAESEGLEFTARIDDPTIELRRCAAPIGTSIEIRVRDQKVMDKFRPSAGRQSFDGNSLILLNSWTEVDWFLQPSPTVVYRWDGFRERYTGGVSRSKLLAEFRPSAKAPMLADNGLQAEWHSLSSPTPYRAIFWKYAAPEKRISGESEYEVQPSDVISVNGMRVQGLSRWIGSGQIPLTLEEVQGGPKYLLLRPSIAIFDPASVCPINLQRNAVSFERMGIDQQLSSSILREHLRNLAAHESSVQTFEEFAKFCGDVMRSRGLKYQGMISPIGCTRQGYFLVSPKFIFELKIHTLIFIDSPKHVGALRSSDLLDGEALLLRTDSRGTQPNLAWFRAIHGGQALRWYAESIGFPAMDHHGAVSILSNELWSLATSHRKVSQHILSAIKSEAVAGGRRLVTTGFHHDSNPLLSRVMSLREGFSEDANISAWKLNKDQSQVGNFPLLLRLWIEQFGGPLMSKCTDIASLPA